MTAHPPAFHEPVDRTMVPGQAGQLRAAPGHRSVCGFTLVELLVSLAIVSLLAALFLPALAQAKRAAYRVQCVNSLHQLGLATQMYWDEHEGQAFRYLEGSTNGGDIYWFGWLERWNGANEGERSFDPTLGPLYPYVQGQRIGLCPALNRHDRFKLKAAGATYGYGYNRHLSPPIHQPAYLIGRLAQPSETVLLADAAQVNNFQYPATPEEPLLEEFYYVSALESKPTAHFRHHLTANVLFCDGHVDRERPLPDSLDPILPQAKVGKLRQEILRVP